MSGIRFKTPVGIEPEDLEGSIAYVNNGLEGIKAIGGFDVSPDVFETHRKACLEFEDSFEEDDDAVPEVPVWPGFYMDYDGDIWCQTDDKAMLIGDFLHVVSLDNINRYNYEEGKSYKTLDPSYAPYVLILYEAESNVFVV